MSSSQAKRKLKYHKDPGAADYKLMEHRVKVAEACRSTTRTSVPLVDRDTPLNNLEIIGDEGVVVPWDVQLAVCRRFASDRLLEGNLDGWSQAVWPSSWNDDWAEDFTQSGTATWDTKRPCFDAVLRCAEQQENGYKIFAQECQQAVVCEAFSRAIYGAAASTAELMDQRCNFRGSPTDALGPRP